MNWEALGAIGELVGALVVMVSVVYLAIQIRHNTRVAKGAAQEAAVATLRELTKQLTQSLELNRLFNEGVGGFDHLDEEERTRWFHLAFQLLKAAEGIHFHYIQGVLDEGAWMGYSNIFRDYFATAGFREYWNVRSDTFSPAFQSYVNTVVLGALPRSVLELARQVEPGQNSQGV